MPVKDVKLPPLIVWSKVLVLRVVPDGLELLDEQLGLGVAHGAA